MPWPATTVSPDGSTRTMSKVGTVTAKARAWWPRRAASARRRAAGACARLGGGLLLRLRGPRPAGAGRRGDGAGAAGYRAEGVRRFVGMCRCGAGADGTAERPGLGAAWRPGAAGASDRRCRTMSRPPPNAATPSTPNSLISIIDLQSRPVRNGSPSGRLSFLRAALKSYAAF